MNTQMPWLKGRTLLGFADFLREALFMTASCFVDYEAVILDTNSMALTGCGYCMSAYIARYQFKANWLYCMVGIGL